MIFLCVHCDKHGLVDMTPDACRKILEWDEVEFAAAMDVLNSPDPDSASRKEDGRRILFGTFGSRGIQVVNYADYCRIQTIDDHKEYMRDYYQERIKPARKLKRAKQSTGVNNSQLSSTDSSHVDVDVDRDIDTDTDRNVSESADVVPGRSLNETIEGVELTCPPKAADALAGFAEFYAAYPRKVKRPAAETAWKAIKGRDQDAIMVGLGRWKEHWAQDESQYTNHPATWIRNRMWEDSPTPNGNRRTKPGYVSAADMDAFAKSVASEGK